MPMFLSMVVGPVLVMDGVPARIEKLAADPRPTVGTIAAFAAVPAIAPIAMTNAMLIIAISALELVMLDAPFGRARAWRVCPLPRMVGCAAACVMTVRSHVTNPSCRGGDGKVMTKGPRRVSVSGYVDQRPDPRARARGVSVARRRR